MLPADSLESDTLTHGIELSGADNEAVSGILDSLQPQHQLICDADQCAIAVVQPVADKRLDESPEGFWRQ